MELVRVCRLAVVAAAAACCSYCDNENPPPPNEARAIRREGRRAISAQLAGRVIRTCQSCIFWAGGWGLSMSIPLVPTNRVDFNTFDRSGHDCSNHPVFTARLSLQRSRWRRYRGHFTGQKNVEISITFSDPYQKCLRKPWKFLFVLFSSGFFLKNSLRVRCNLTTTAAVMRSLAGFGLLFVTQ